MNKYELNNSLISLINIKDSFNVHIYESIDSTNEKAKEYLDNNDIEIFVSSSQSKGKGRKGHSFYSPKGGLYLSYAFHPLDEKLSIEMTTLISAISCVNAIYKTCKVKTDIKWVNDIYLNNKKMGGILCESIRNNDSSLKGIIIGIGLNIYENQFPDEIKDIATALNVQINLNELTSNIINELYKWLNINDIDLILKEYKKHLFILGKEVSFIKDNKEYNGIAFDINDKGNLLIQLKNGEIVSLSSGEISLHSW